MRTKLKEFYLDYVNNYLTVEKIAEHNGLDIDDANKLIELGKNYHAEDLAFAISKMEALLSNK